MSLLSTIRFIANHPLNRAHKLGSIIRYAKWQIGSRLVPGAVVYEWVNGSKFIVKSGEKGLTGNIYCGLHEFPSMGFLLHFLRSEDLFVDVGANLGSYTILACSAVGARGVAFEPVPCTFTKLVENIRLNHLDGKVTCINKAVGNRVGTLAFTSTCNTTDHVLLSGEPCDNKIIVEVTTLDTALAGENPSLIKIDVEGYETPVLAGAQATLKKQMLKAVILELAGIGNRYGFDESKLVEGMLCNGFKTYSYNPITRKLTAVGGRDIHSGNTLFIRDISFVEDRLKTAPTVTINGQSF